MTGAVKTDEIFPLNASLLEQVRRFLSGGKHYSITTHVRPDGDAIGSVAALRRWLAARGKQATIVLLSPPSQRYDWVLKDEPVVVAQGNASLLANPPGDRLIIADTSALLQLPGLEPFLESGSKPTLVIDHHVKADPIGDLRVADHEACAAGLMIAELFEMLGEPVESDIAEPLFLAIAADTGWFQYSNTDARTFQCASRLLESGVRPDLVHRLTYDCERPSRMRLAGEMLRRLEMHLNGRVVVSSITQTMFRQYEAEMGDTEGLINELQRVGSALAMVLLLELPGGKIRVSLRSKDFVDVNAVASEFGGGGHVKAAGATAEGNLEKVKRRVIASLGQALEKGMAQRK
jgi:phosphoesterase RecJ-like protein